MVTNMHESEGNTKVLLDELREKVEDALAVVERLLESGE